MEADEATSLEKFVEPYLMGLPQAIKSEIKRLEQLSKDEVQQLL